MKLAKSLTIVTGKMMRVATALALALVLAVLSPQTPSRRIG